MICSHLKDGAGVTVTRELVSYKSLLQALPCTFVSWTIREFGPLADRPLLRSREAQKGLTEHSQLLLPKAPSR